MNQITAAIHDTPVFLSMEAAVEPVAPYLISALSSIPKEKMKEGARVQIGFSDFLFHSEGDGFRILAPDYKAQPTINTTEDLTIALWVLFEQAKFVSQYRLNDAPIRYFDRITVAKDALLHPLLSLQRFSELKEHSGWVIESLQRQADGSILAVSDEYETIFAFELLKARPELIKLLVLPFDYFAVIEGSEIKEIQNEKGESLLRSR